MRDKSFGIGGIGVQTEIDYKLVIGRYLYIVPGLELAVEHVIFLHAHKRSTRIGLAVTVTACQYLLLPGILFQLGRPVLFGIVQLLLYFTIHFLYIFECLSDVINSLFHTFGVDLIKIRRSVIPFFCSSQFLGILP